MNPLQLLLILLLLSLFQANLRYDFSLFDEKMITKDDEGNCLKAECVQEMDATSCYKIDKKS